MYFPFLTRSETSGRQLYRRKGGRKSGGGYSIGGSSGSGGKSTGSISSGKSSIVYSGGGFKSATAYGAGGGHVLVIPAGEFFAGRLAGGGMRSEIYGNRGYGSGYPGISGRGTAGRGFPFFFWPLSWGNNVSASSDYLYNTEYGSFDNTTRPGGIMMTAAFSSSSQNTTFRIVADNVTISSLIVDIVANCSSDIASPLTITSATFNDSLASPKPEQTVQYYRASSVAMTLDGYNNTGALGPEGTSDIPLPTNIDTNLLNCLNSTIGEAVPLIGSAGLRFMAPPVTIGIFNFIWLLWCLSSVF